MTSSIILSNHVPTSFADEAQNFWLMKHFAKHSIDVIIAKEASIIWCNHDYVKANNYYNHKLHRVPNVIMIILNLWLLHRYNIPGMHHNSHNTHSAWTEHTAGPMTPYCPHLLGQQITWLAVSQICPSKGIAELRQNLSAAGLL